MSGKKNWPKKKLAEKKIGRKKTGRNIGLPLLPHRAVCKKNENIEKNIFLVLYIMFKAPISTIPQ
jgi:hypothetical protein